MVYEIPYYSHSVGRKYRFGMELYAVNVEFPVTQRHYVAFFAARRHFETFGKAFVAYYPRMVTPHRDFVLQAVENIIVVRYFNGSLYSVKDIHEVHELCSEGFADCLFAEANTQHGLLVCIFAYYVEQQPGFGRYSRPGRQDYLVVFPDVAEFEPVVAYYFGLCPESLNGMSQIVGE